MDKVCNFMVKYVNDIEEALGLIPRTIRNNDLSFSLCPGSHSHQH